MRAAKLFSIFALIAVGFAACSNSSSDTSDLKIKQALSHVEKSIIVDVRTVQEWNNDGHADCSINYPLAQLESKVEALKSYNKIILVCRSGSRASTAKQLLEDAGIKNIENKGPWQNIICKK
jgi:phage shock protein E